MIKGQLKIELKNEQTGEVEVHKEENMITNAMLNLIGLGAVMGYNGSIFPELIPLAQKGLGGILLFDGTINEDADNFHFPMDVHLTGTAGRLANSTSKITGSFNSTESMRTDTGYTSVWDFSTSQANGTIASLGLTNYKAGNYPFHGTITNVNAGYSINAGYPLMLYDAKNEKMILYNGNGKLICKHVFSNIIHVNSPDFSEEEEVFDFGFTYTYWFVGYGGDGYIYAVYTKGSSAKTSINFKVRKVKVSDYSFEEEAEMDFNISNITCAATSSPTQNIRERFAFSKGYLYFISADNKTVYKVNLSNIADVKEFTFGDAYVYYLYTMYNGGVHAMFGYYITTSSGTKQMCHCHGWIYPDGKYRYDETLNVGTDLYGYTGPEGDNLYLPYMYSNSVRHCFATNYLGTICNLSSPIVKTSAQSMKVTYTLTDA